jgi:hypothetical protein
MALAPVAGVSGGALLLCNLRNKVHHPLCGLVAALLLLSRPAVVAGGSGGACCLVAALEVARAVVLLGALARLQLAASAGLCLDHWWIQREICCLASSCITRLGAGFLT